MLSGLHSNFRRKARIWEETRTPQSHTLIITPYTLLEWHVGCYLAIARCVCVEVFTGIWLVLVFCMYTCVYSLHKVHFKCCSSDMVAR